MILAPHVLDLPKIGTVPPGDPLVSCGNAAGAFPEAGRNMDKTMSRSRARLVRVPGGAVSPLTAWGAVSGR
jgi:hypothetical protein